MRKQLNIEIAQGEHKSTYDINDPKGNLGIPLGLKASIKNLGISLGYTIQFNSSSIKAIYYPEKLVFKKEKEEFPTSLFHRYLNLKNDLDDLFSSKEKDLHGRPYIHNLKRDIEFSKELSSWLDFVDPKNQNEASFLLTHDVDIPNKNDFLKSYSFFPKNASLKSFFQYHKNFILKLARYIIRPKNDYWNFQEIIELEKKFGFTSTFLFSTQQKNTGYTNPIYDVDYNIESEEINRAFDTIKEFGFNIGLHSSYNVSEKGAKYKEELEKLDGTTHEEAISFHRNHFYRFGSIPSKALTAMYHAGIAIDTSIKSAHKNDCPLGLYHPYQLKDKDGFINCWELPTLMMDSHFFDKNTTKEDKINSMKSLIDSVIESKGTVSINWHVRTSISKNNNFKAWGELYMEVLKYLKERNANVISGKKLLNKLNS